eukprot:symbB.v1.2.013558.t1/scaffold952.1/size217748/16
MRAALLFLLGRLGRLGVGLELPDLDDDIPEPRSFDYAVAIGADGDASHGRSIQRLEARSLNEIMPHEWDAPAVLPQQNEHRDPDGKSASDEQADVDEEEAEAEADNSEDIGKATTDFAFTYRQHVVGSTPTGSLGIGTPAVNLNMILDTGSDKFVAKTWATIKAELEKIDAGASDEVFPGAKIYNHNASKSYMQLFASQNGSKVPRQGFIAYGSGMAITLEGRETIRIGDQQKFVSMQKFPISEISLDSLQILHSSKGISGILGLQHMMNKSLGQSFYSVLRDKGVLHSFGYCRGKEDDGSFIWGDKSSDGKEVNVEGQMHWAVKLKNMHVQKAKHHTHHASLMERFEARNSDDESLLEDDAQNHSQFHKFHLCRKSHCVAVIDTGSNIIAMPSEAVRTLSKMLNVQTDCSNMARLPHLHFVLGEDVHISLPPSAYIMKVQLPRLKEEPKADSADSADSGDSDSKSEETETQPTEEVEDDDTIENSHFRTTRRHRSSPAELAETETQEQRYLAQVDSLVEDTYREHGLDLRAVVQVDLASYLRNSTTLCMPAIVPLDRETQKGTLLVVGGPLFEKYYTRWSWPKGKEPKIYVKNLQKAEECLVKEEKQETNEADETSKSAPKMTVWRSHDGRMIRAEKAKRHHHATRSDAAELNEDSAEIRLREMNLDEIRYPHWAKHLNEL